MIFRNRITKMKLVKQLTLATLDGPSWIDLAENRVNTTESRFAAGLNRLLQQNWPTTEVVSNSNGGRGSPPGHTVKAAQV
jgi:hypothetical protein